MKSKQCLDVHQMQYLQELGLELKETMLYWARCVDNNPRAATHYGKWVLIKGDNAQTVGLMHWEFIPAYTLQDVLDALPIQIEIPLYPGMGKYELRIKRFVFDKRRVMHAVLYEKDDYIDWFVMQSYETLIDAAYEMLVWAIDNKFVETNKNK